MFQSKHFNHSALNLQKKITKTRFFNKSLLRFSLNTQTKICVLFNSWLLSYSKHTPIDPIQSFSPAILPPLDDPGRSSVLDLFVMGAADEAIDEARRPATVVCSSIRLNQKRYH